MLYGLVLIDGIAGECLAFVQLGVVYHPSVTITQSHPQANPAETSVCRAQVQAGGFAPSAAVPQGCGGGEGLDHRETTGIVTMVTMILMK